MDKVYGIENMKKMIILPIFFFLFLTGCGISEEGKKSIQEAADTAQARAVNFDLIQNNIVAKNPEQSALVEEWKKIHSEGLHAEAKALSDFNKVVNPPKKDKK